MLRSYIIFLDYNMILYDCQERKRTHEQEKPGEENDREEVFIVTVTVDVQLKKENMSTM